MHGSIVRSIRSATKDSNLARVNVVLKCFGPVASAVRYGRLISVLVLDDSSIFAFSAYAFYKIIMAIYNVFRSSKEEALTVQTVRCIGLADALVSIFSLQTALLYAFSEGNEMDYFNAITGIAVVVLTVIIGIYMIVKGQKTIKKQKEKSYE